MRQRSFLKIQTIILNPNDPVSSSILKPLDTLDCPIFSHFTGCNYVKDTKATRSLLSTVAELHNIKITFVE
jgi:hypothetical protein